MVGNARDFSLLPKMEEWGSGDEAIDSKLDIALKRTLQDLSMESILDFYFFALGLKTRVYNPAFNITIELVVKALLYFFSPRDFNDHLFFKIKGCFHEKMAIKFDWDGKKNIVLDLENIGRCRYNEQLDFYLHRQERSERNPFVRYPILKSSNDLHVKIVFKDFKNYLSGEKDEAFFSDPFFRALRLGKTALIVEDFGIFWYHKDQIFSLSYL